MRLTRLFVPATLAEGADLLLEPHTAQHVTRVLRMQAGDALALFDGAGAEHGALIASAKGPRVTVRIGAALVPAAESALRITLAQAVSRAERMDFAVQKATELGVARIVPVLSERSVVKLDERQAAAKLEHWQGVVIAACEQSGRATLPLVESPRRLLDYLAETPPATDGSLRAVLVPGAAEGFGALPASLGIAELLIGPEGGFSEDETRLALGRGYRALRLGPRILRTETAAAAAIAVLQALRGDLG